MGYETDYRSKMGHTDGYEVIEAVDPIVAAAQHITSTYVEQIALVAITLRFDSGTEGKGHGVAKPNSRMSKRLAQRNGGDTSPEETAPFVEMLSEEQVARYLLDNLRPLVRKTDCVFLLEHTLYFLLPGANRQGGQIVQSRLWEALLWHVNHITDARAEGATEQQTPVFISPCTITIGHSAYPMPCIDFDEFIRAADDVILRFDWQPQHPQRPKQCRGRREVEVGENDHKEPRPGQRTSPPAQESVDEELPALARKLGIPYLSLLPSKLPAGVQQLVDPKLAQELHCYPLGRERNMLTVAMLNPRDHSALERLHQETGLHIFPVLTHPQALQTALEQLIC